MAHEKWFRRWGFKTVYPIHWKGWVLLASEIALLFWLLKLFPRVQNNLPGFLALMVLVIVVAMGGGAIVERQTEDPLSEEIERVVKQAKEEQGQ